MGTTIYGIDDEVMEPGLDPKERGYPGFNPRQVTVDGLTIDVNVQVLSRGPRAGPPLWARPLVDRRYGSYIAPRAAR